MTAYIEKDRAKIRLDGDTLIVVVSSTDHEEREEVVSRIPLHQLERLILYETVQVTSQALCHLMRKGIPVLFVDWRGRSLGHFSSPAKSMGAARLRQYKICTDPKLSLAMAASLVDAKLFNQIRLVQRCQGNRPLLTESDLDRLSGFRDGVRGVRDVETLMGVEGAGTAFYFQAWSRFLPEEYPFEKRSTRPPLNAVNACISFGSTLIYNELAAIIQQRGLDPGLGILHATEDGRWSLALDLMEPFRPAIIEALTLFESV